jgi:hypothetical protein
MDKISRIAAAALLASSMSYAAPAFAVDTTAEDFVVALSADFSTGDLGRILAKLQELQRLGLDGILFDNDEFVSVEKLIALLGDVQDGDLTGAGVAATLLAYIEQSDQVRFIDGGVYMNTADLGDGAPAGSVFPAGSAG